MKRALPILFLILVLLTACGKPAANSYWLEMNYANLDRTTSYSLNMPITVQEDKSLYGLGILVIRQVIIGETKGYPECLAGEKNGVRVRGEVSVIGVEENRKVLVQSLEPTGSPESFSYIFYCVKDGVERDVKTFNLDMGSTAGPLFANYIIDALYIFSEGMLKYPLDEVEGISGEDGQGFRYVFHLGLMPESAKVPTPMIP